jgi:uncharacterized membrane protein YphA (DoxX/SURF4 family)
MKITRIIYWLATVLICFFMGFSGYNDLVKNPEFVASMQHRGYPIYLLTFLGTAKVGAVIVLLLPIKSRIKDWAYAGISFDLLGASYSHYMSGDGTKEILIPLVAFAITLISYYLYLTKKQ